MKIIHNLVAICLLANLWQGARAEDDTKIVPGLRIGPVVLGMTEKEVTQGLGNHDGIYDLSGGIKVEYSEWKEPGKTSTIRVFYNKAGRVVQITAEAPGVATENGISIKSTLDEVSQSFKNLRLLSYAKQDGFIDLYDAKAQGICFAFERSKSEKKANSSMHGIVVHRPGSSVILDRDVSI